MPAVFRWLFTFAAAVSLLICVLTTAAWCLRTSGSDRWEWTTTSSWQAQGSAKRRSWWLRFSGGAVSFERGAWDVSSYEVYALQPKTNDFTHAVDAAGPIPAVSPWPPQRTRSKMYFLWGAFGAAGADGFGPWRGFRFFVVRLPLWFVFLVSAVLPAAWEIHHRRRFGRRQRARAGFCFNCGYDLRESPERCPECGTIPKGARAVSE